MTLLKDSRPAEKVLHPSTQAAMAALARLKDQGFFCEKVLDVGCGSGLLTLVARQYWPEAHIIATDISAQAIADASENLHEDVAAGKVTLAQADGVSHPLITQMKPYDLIVANVLPEPLVAIAKAVLPLIAPTGALVISGLREWEIEPVLEAYLTVGFTPLGEDVFFSGDWAALLLSVGTE